MATVVLGLTGAADAAYIPFAADRLSWDDGDITAQGDWAESGTRFAYAVFEGVGEDDGLWQYSYALSVTERDISHFIVEVSGSFTDENLIDGDGGKLDLHKASDPDKGPNPAMPEGLYGIKWNTGGKSTTVSTDILTDRAPIWGDFYGKDGKAQSGDVFNALWNSGFGSPDLDPAIDYENFTLVSDHILVPDTISEPPVPPAEQVPVPATAALFGLGLGGLFGMARRRRATKAAR